MRAIRRVETRWRAACIAAGALMAWGAATGLAAQAPVATSAAKAKEVAALLAAKKLETFAAREGEKSRYVAVLLVPNVQLLVVSAAYSRDNDIEYSLYNKQYQNAYLDLRSGIYGSDRFLVDDALADGLVALPGKNPQHDTVKMDTVEHAFDGKYGGAKSRDPKRPPQDVYMKTYADADARYAKLLDVLIAQLKGTEALAARQPMR